MALNVTTWTPSTCRCEIQYEWDSEHLAELRLHKIVNVKHCAAAGIADGHPRVQLGEILECSAFYEDHVVIANGREHWDKVVKANPHWKSSAK